MRKWEQVDWEEEYKRLVVVAAYAARTHPQTFDMGLSAEDVVHKVLLEFFESDNGLGWNPSRGSLSAFLGRRVKQRLLDHRRRQKKVAGSIDDNDSSLRIPAACVEPVAPREHSYAEFKGQLLNAVGPNQELRDLIEAPELTDDGANVNQQLAEILDKPVSKVVNAKRRLMNIQEVREIYESRK